MNVDVAEEVSPDKIIDLNEVPWDLPSNQFDEVYTSHVLEHLKISGITSLEEIHRICRDGAIVVVYVPYKGVEGVHQQFFDGSLPRYFTEEAEFSYYTDKRYNIIENKLRFSKRKLLFWNYVVEPVIQKLPIWVYHSTFLQYLFPAEEIYWKLEVKK